MYLNGSVAVSVLKRPRLSVKHCVYVYVHTSVFQGGNSQESCVLGVNSGFMHCTNNQYKDLSLP